LVGRPHNLLKLDELGEEARSAVVDLRGVLRHYVPKLDPKRLQTRT
jgi:hypothetical protein